MAKIAISYRRSDAGFVARILYDRLVLRYGPLYGENAVYMDLEDIPGGKDYEVEFGSALKDCDVMLAIMGSSWLGGVKPGHTKISDPTDPVRQELELATLLKIRILPVLVDGAEMVKETKLPQKLKYIATLNAEEVRNNRLLNAYIQHVCDTIDKMMGPAPASNPAPAPTVSVSPRAAENTVRWAWLLALMASFIRPMPVAAAVLVGAVGGAAYWSPGVFKTQELPPEIANNIPGRWPSTTINPTGGPTVRVTVSAAHLEKVPALRSIAFSRGTMAVAGDDGVIRLWNAGTFRFEKAIPVLPSGIGRHSKPSPAMPRPHAVHKVAFSAMGDALYSAGLDNKVRVIDPATGLVIQELVAEADSRLSSLHSLAAFPGKPDASGRMRFVAAGGDDGCVRVWDIDEVDASKKLKWRLTGAGAGELATEECKSAAPEDQKEVAAFAYSPKARDYYVVGNYDGTLSFVIGRYNRSAIRAGDKPIWDVAFSPTGDQVASADGTGVVKIWNFDEHKLFKELPALRLPVWSVAWEGQALLTGDAGPNVWLWNAVTAFPSGPAFKGHEKNVVAVAFHPEGKWLVSAGEDGLLKVWERDGKSREALITIIAYKSDGNDQYVIIHRDGTFTGPSSEVIRYIDMKYLDGSRKGELLPADLKRTLYRSTEEFARKLAAGS